MISIVMPTYNQAQYIEEALDSFLSQTFEDWELYIVDDGCTDNTECLITPYLLDERIQYLKKSNGGTGSALNEGFKHTVGEFETWFASDNILYPQALETLHKVLVDNDNIDHIHSDMDIIGCPESTNATLRRSCKLSDLLDPTRVDRLIEEYCLGAIWMWKKSIREKVGEFQTQACEDYDMALRMQEAGCRFTYIPVVLGQYRRHGASLTQFDEQKTLRALQDVMNRAKERRRR